MGRPVFVPEIYSKEAQWISIICRKILADTKMSRSRRADLLELLQKAHRELNDHNLEQARKGKRSEEPSIRIQESKELK